MTRHFGRISRIEYRAIILYLSAQQRVPILIRVVLTHSECARWAIAEVLIQRPHIGESTRIYCRVLSLKGVAEVCHECRNGLSLSSVILTLDICLKHVIPVVGVVKVARGDIYALHLRGVCLRYTLCALGPAVVVHDSSHSRLRTARKAMRIAIQGALVVIGCHLAPARGVEHDSTNRLIPLAPLLGSRLIRHDVMLAGVAHRSVYIAQPTLKAGW